MKEKKRFHDIADTSLEELKSYFYLCYDLNYINKRQSEELIDLSREVDRMLYKLSKNVIY